MSATMEPMDRTRPHQQPGGLTIENFKMVGVRGMTDPRNAYTQAMAWFGDKLIIGMTRDPLCLMKRPNRLIPPPETEFWPVNCRDPEDPLLMRGQILSYHPETDKWRLAYRSPMVIIDEAFQTTDRPDAMRDVGYRGMAILKGTSDPCECLYTGSISSSGARLIRSEDGVKFAVTPGALDGPSIRSLVACKGRLFTAIVGTIRTHGNESAHTELLGSWDPASGEWFEASLPGFGDPSNRALYDMAEFNGYLYVTTMNFVSGFQLWKSDLEGPPPYRWTKVLTTGAHRGFLNEFGISMCAFNGCLYVGTGIAGGGYDRVRSVGPAPAELLRVYPDDTWDLVVGAARATPDGFKVPISGMGPGFDNFLNGYVWRMCVHQGWLYVSTFNAGCFARFNPHKMKQMPRNVMEFYEKFLPLGSIERFMEEFGGCHLYRTCDGERFEPVTRDGFGSGYNFGIRQLASSPYGVFAGTANPFGPEVGIKRDGRWQYEFNTRGGAEIWCGSEGIHTASPRPHHKERERQYRRALNRLGRQLELYLNTFLFDDYYAGSGFHHIGLWEREGMTPTQACEALMERLVAMAGGAERVQGTVLDVVCGKGGSTQWLRGRLARAHVIGIDESQWAIDAGLGERPDLELVCDVPHSMARAEGSVDTLVCAEGALHVDTRYRFFVEAARVLAPGGRLVMADRLLNHDAIKAHPRRYRANYVRDLPAYRRRLEQAGFVDVRIEDVTQQAIPPYLEAVQSFLSALYREGTISEGKYSAAMAFVSRTGLFTRYHVLVSATRPADEATRSGGN